MDILYIYAIKALLLPIASLLILGFTGLFLLRQRNLAVAFIFFSLIMLLLLSLPVVTRYLAINLEAHSPLDLSALKSFSPQAIVILGGGLRSLAPEYSQQVTVSDSTLIRVRYGSRLAKQTNLPILVSGGKVFNTELPSEAEIMSSVLENEYNQPVKWQEHKSRNTAENALYSSELLNRIGIKRIILVTQAYHMPRAVDEFKKHGLQIIPAPTVFLSKTAPLNILSFLPSAHALSHNTMFIHEILGRGWMLIVSYFK